MSTQRLVPGRSHKVYQNIVILLHILISFSSQKQGNVSAVKHFQTPGTDAEVNSAWARQSNN